MSDLSSDVESSFVMVDSDALSISSLEIIDEVKTDESPEDWRLVEEKIKKHHESEAESTPATTRTEVQTTPASEPNLSIGEPSNDESEPSETLTASECIDFPKPDALPILEAIHGTWKMIAQENIEEYTQIVHDTPDYLDRTGSLLKVNVQESCIKLALRSPSGQLHLKTTTMIVPKNPWPTQWESYHNYVEGNAWISTREDLARWTRAKIQDGQLRVEYHYGPVFYTDVYEKVHCEEWEQDGDSEVSEAPIDDEIFTEDHPNPDALPLLEEINGVWKRIHAAHATVFFGDILKISVDNPNVSISTYSTSGVLVDTNAFNVEEKVEGQYQLDYIEKNQWIALTEDGHHWRTKLIVDGQLLVDFYVESVRYTDVYERCQDSEVPSEHTAITIEDSRPILNEISGFWKLVAQENLQNFHQKVYGSTDYVDDLGKALKLRARNMDLDIWRYSKSGSLEECRRAVIASRDVEPTRTCMSQPGTYIHDYIEDNQWFSVSENPAEYNVKWIEKGQLKIEYHCGEEFYTNVFERAQDTTYDFEKLCFLVIALVIFLILAAFFD